jgi:hypothetical protein
VRGESIRGRSWLQRKAQPAVVRPACTAHGPCRCALPLTTSLLINPLALSPQGLSRPLVNWLLASVKAAHGIDLERVAPVESIRHCHMPVLFLKVEGDDTVPPESANELHAAHRGPGAVVTLVGSHNGVRTPEVVDLMLKFVDKHSSAWVSALLHRRWWSWWWSWSWCCFVCIVPFVCMQLRLGIASLRSHLTGV